MHALTSVASTSSGRGTFHLSVNLFIGRGKLSGPGNPKCHVVMIWLGLKNNGTRILDAACVSHPGWPPRSMVDNLHLKQIIRLTRRCKQISSCVIRLTLSWFWNQLDSTMSEGHHLFVLIVQNCLPPTWRHLPDELLPSNLCCCICQATQSSP